MDTDKMDTDEFDYEMEIDDESSSFFKVSNSIISRAVNLLREIDGVVVGIADGMVTFTKDEIWIAALDPQRFVDAAVRISNFKNDYWRHTGTWEINLVRLLNYLNYTAVATFPVFDLVSLAEDIKRYEVTDEERINSMKELQVCKADVKFRVFLHDFNHIYHDFRGQDKVTVRITQDKVVFAGETLARVFQDGDDLGECFILFSDEVTTEVVIADISQLIYYYKWMQMTDDQAKENVVWIQHSCDTSTPTILSLGTELLSDGVAYFMIYLHKYPEVQPVHVNRPWTEKDITIHKMEKLSRMYEERRKDFDFCYDMEFVLSNSFIRRAVNLLRQIDGVVGGIADAIVDFGERVVWIAALDPHRFIDAAVRIIGFGHDYWVDNGTWEIDLNQLWMYVNYTTITTLPNIGCVPGADDIKRYEVTDKEKINSMKELQVYKADVKFRMFVHDFKHIHDDFRGQDKVTVRITQDKVVFAGETLARVFQNGDDLGQCLIRSKNELTTEVVIADISQLLYYYKWITMADQAKESEVWILHFCDTSTPTILNLDIQLTLDCAARFRVYLHKYPEVQPDNMDML